MLLMIISEETLFYSATISIAIILIYTFPFIVHLLHLLLLPQVCLAAASFSYVNQADWIDVVVVVAVVHSNIGKL